MKQCVYCALNEALYSLSLVFLQPYVTLSVKGVELKLVRGGEELFGLRAKISPHLSDFSPPGHDFCPPLGILFQFFLSEKLSQGNFPPSPQFYAHAACKAPSSSSFSS